MRSLLQELRANITPNEKESVGLPSSVTRILPDIESEMVSNPTPVRVERSQWVRQEEPERLIRVYEFDAYEQLVSFVTDVLDYHMITNHRGDLHILENQVRAEVWTRGMDRVTELDVEYANELDMICQDVPFRFTSSR